VRRASAARLLAIVHREQITSDRYFSGSWGGYHRIGWVGDSGTFAEDAVRSFADPHGWTWTSRRDGPSKNVSAVSTTDSATHLIFLDRVGREGHAKIGQDGVLLYIEIEWEN